MAGEIRKVPGGSPTVTVGAGLASVTPGGVLYATVTPASNVTTGETVLATYSLPANTLSVDTKGVRVWVSGSLAATGNTKQVRLYFGATASLVLSATTSGQPFRASMVVLRTGAATQVGFLEFSVGGGTNALFATTPTETLSGPVVIKITGQSGAASNDLTLTAMVVEALA